LAASPYIPEEQTADWISLGVRDFFRNAGYRVITYKLTQHLEKDLPADRTFLDPATWKIFGFQYKTLYHNGEDRWPLDEVQHETLVDFPWIYYCLSELTDPREEQTALHQARIHRVSFNYRPAILQKERRSPRYYSWGEFYLGLKRCTFGQKLWSPIEFERLAKKVHGKARQKQVRQMYELFLVELDQRLFFARESLPSNAREV
jgi:hypothetical protein